MGTAGAVIFLPREGNRKSAMLENILFDPAAVWLSKALERAGIAHFLVVCHQEDRDEVAACFPPDTVLITTGTADAGEHLSAFLREQEGNVIVVTRPVYLGTAEARTLLHQRLILNAPQEPERETGVCRIDAATLADALDTGTPIERAILEGADKLNNHSIWFQDLQLLNGDWGSRVESELLARNESAIRLLESGVHIVDPNSVYVGPRTQVGRGSLLLPGTILRGRTLVGEDCEIGPNAMVRDSTLGDRVTVNASQINESVVLSDTKVGPFAYIRPGCTVGQGVKVGDFVELKNSTIGDGTKISHLTYVGDSDVGRHVNFGCGTVTVNYDGVTKYRTTIGDNAFIGCNTNLVAPVQIGDGAYTAAGSTITDDVPADSLAIARDRQIIKKQWAAKRRGHRS